LPRFNEPVFVNAIQKFGIRSTVVVPPIVLAMSKHPETAFRTLRTLFFGGTTLPSGVVDHMYAKLPASAVARQVYGMTELGVCIVWTRKERDLTGSIGQPLPGYKLR